MPGSGAVNSVVSVLRYIVLWSRGHGDRRLTHPTRTYTEAFEAPAIVGISKAHPTNEEVELAEAILDGVQDVRTLIIGGGIGGIGTAIELTRRKDDDFVIVDRGSRPGGVWRDNQYPNAAVDTPIELYAFAHSLGSKWSSNYAPWNEIVEYIDDLIEENGLAPHLLFNTEIESLVWDPEIARWQVAATDGTRWRARFVVWAGGLLNKPSVPDIPGIESFAGTAFHTAQWPDDIDLSGRKVLVIGGGATSVQVVPYAAQSAAHVYALVRTPSYVMPKPEVFFDDEDRARFISDPSAQAKERARLLEGFEELTRTRFPMDPERVRKTEDIWRASFDELVTDPHLRELLAPKYRFGCRRPLVSNDYYQAFQKSTVTGLGGSVLGAEADGVITSELGKIEVDTIIYATGFDAQGMLGDLRIENGRGDALNEEWKTQPRAYLGTMVKGYPNLFLINGPNSGGPVATDVIAGQASLLANCMEWAGESATVEIDPTVFDEAVRDVSARAEASVLVQGGCTSWYRSGGGVGEVFSHWPGTIASIREALARTSPRELVITEARDRSLSGQSVH